MTAYYYIAFCITEYNSMIFYHIVQLLPLLYYTVNTYIHY